MPRKTPTRRGVLTLTGGALVALAGCSNSGGQETTETDTEAPMETDTESPMDTETEAESPTEAETTEEEDMEGDSMAMLRVAHLSPDAPNVDVAVDGETALSDVAFETVSDYLSLDTGDHDVTVTPTGGSTPVFAQTVTLSSGRQTAAAVGEVEGDDQAFTVALFAEDASFPAVGNTKLRVVHAVPDAPSVDVTTSDRTVADDVSFGEASDYSIVRSDTRSVAIRPESTGNNASRVGTVRVDTPSEGLETLFLAGYLEPTEQQPDLRGIAVTDATPEEETGTETATETETGTTTTETGTTTPTETATEGM